MKILLLILQLTFCTSVLSETPIKDLCSKKLKCTDCCLKYSSEFVEVVIKKCSANPYAYDGNQNNSNKDEFILDVSRLDSGRLSKEVDSFECTKLDPAKKKALREEVYSCLKSCRGKTNGK